MRKEETDEDLRLSTGKVGAGKQFYSKAKNPSQGPKEGRPSDHKTSVRGRELLLSPEKCHYTPILKKTRGERTKQWRGSTSWKENFYLGANIHFFE